MINIMLPCCAVSEPFKESYYPKNLYDVGGKPMIQHVIENYRDLKDKRFIFLFLQEECDKFHTDQIARKLSADTPTEIIILKNVTGGALCTGLMAVDFVNNDEPLIIANGDQLIKSDIGRIVRGFIEKQYDGAVICFDDNHPRWTYARIVKEQVVELVKKRPVSSNAIAGFYYYHHGRDFVESAKSAIIKDSNYDGRYYLLASINEMILKNKHIGYCRINPEDYLLFYSPEMISELDREQLMGN